jgi:hypothetical protein
MTERDERQAEYERHLYEGYQHAHRDYDQAILALSGGTLAVSVTFAQNMTPDPVDGSIASLVVARFALGGAIIFVVASFLLSQWAFRDRLSNLDRFRPITRREKATGALNLLSGIALVLGLLLLGRYAFINLV